VKIFHWLGAALLAIYIVWAVQAASYKRLWYDELFTLAIARQYPANMQRAETARFDFNPPMVYLVSSAALRLPLAEEISLRVASIVGFALFAFSLVVFVGRRLGFPYGLIAGSIALTGTNTQFALEARPYGVLVGFVGLALVGWQAASDEEQRWRNLGLAGVAIGLAGALASHVFALLLYFPFGIAELWRWLERKRPDWGIAIAFLASLAPVAFYPPLLAASRQLTLAGPLYALNSSRVLKSYGMLLMSTLELFPMLLVLWFMASQTRRASSLAWAEVRARVPIRERVLATTLMILPLAGYLLADLGHAIFMPRYSLAFISGFAILLTYLTYGWSRAKAESAWLFAGTAIACMIFPIIGTSISSQHPPRAGQEREALLEMARGDDPIVVSNGMLFLEMNRYLTPKIARRLVFVADPELALKRVKSDGVDRPLAMSVPWTKPLGRVVRYADFISGHKVFWWYGTGQHPLDWTLAQLNDGGANIETVAAQGEYRLNRVKLP